MERKLVEDYSISYKEVEKLESMLKEASNRLEKAKEKLIEHFEASGIERTATYEGIGFISRMKPRLYASCIEENKPILFQHLRDEGRDDLIKEVVNPQSLSTYISELLENGKPTPECVSFVLKTGVRLYSAKS